MPVQSCNEKGKPGFKWGSSGTCFTYTKGDKKGQGAARAKAAKQGDADDEERSNQAAKLDDQISAS